MKIVIDVNKDILKSLLADAELYDCSLERVLQRRVHIKLPAPELKSSKIEKPEPKPQKEARKPASKSAPVEEGNSGSVAAQMSRGLTKPKPHTGKEPFRLMDSVPMQNMQTDIVNRENTPIVVEDLLGLLVHAPTYRIFTFKQLVESLDLNIQQRITPAGYKSLAQQFYRQAKLIKRIKYDGSKSPIQYWVEG